MKSSVKIIATAFVQLGSQVEKRKLPAFLYSSDPILSIHNASRIHWYSPSSQQNLHRDILARTLILPDQYSLEMEPNGNDDLRTDLLEIDGNLVLPPSALGEQSDFNIDKPFTPDVRPDVDQEITNILQNIGEQTSELTIDLFEPLIPPFLGDAGKSGNQALVSQKRSLSTLSLQSGEESKRTKIIESQPRTVDNIAPIVLNEKNANQNDNGQDEYTSGAKPKHVCKECSKVFKRAHNLKIHGRLHSGAKPYSCPFAMCEKEFRWKSSIVSHMNWHRTKKGDMLPGEPEDTSVQAAALRQGTTRRPNRERKAKVKNRRVAQVEEAVIANNEPVALVTLSNDKCASAGTVPQGINVKEETGMVEEGEQQQGGDTKTEPHAADGDEKAEKEWTEGCGYDVTVDLNDFMVEMTQLTEVYMGSGEMKAEGEGGEGGNNNRGADGAFTPSTTADSFDHSTAAVELDDLVSISMSGVKPEEARTDEREGGMLGDLSDCGLEGIAYPFVGLLE